MEEKDNKIKLYKAMGIANSFVDEYGGFMALCQDKTGCVGAIPIPVIDNQFLFEARAKLLVTDEQKENYILLLIEDLNVFKGEDWSLLGVYKVIEVSIEKQIEALVMAIEG